MSTAPLFSEIAHGGVKNEVGGRKDSFAQAFGLATCAFAARTVVGPIWGGMVLARFGWGTMGWSLSLLSAVSVGPVWIYISGDVDAEE